MKRIFARIGMYLTVTDEEWEKLESDYYFENALSKELVERFLKQGEPCLSPVESYIPNSVFDEPEYYEA